MAYKELPEKVFCPKCGSECSKIGKIHHFDKDGKPVYTWRSTCTNAKWGWFSRHLYREFVGGYYQEYADCGLD